MNNHSLSSPEAHFVMVSQKVRDIKVDGGKRRDELADSIGRLRHGLRKRAFIPGDKLNAKFRPQLLSADGKLQLDIYGGMLRGSDLEGGLDMHIHHELPLDVRDESGVRATPMAEQMLHEVLARCEGVSMDDGGNVQNMTVNLSLVGLGNALRQKLRMTVFSTSDPFANVGGPLGEAVAKKREAGDITVAELPGIPDRVAIQMPWRWEGDHGTFAMTTEPNRTSDALSELLRNRPDLRKLFRQGNCYVSAEPLFGELKQFDVKPPYGYIINAATAFRSLVATNSYGTNVVLPMNKGEASDVVRLLKQRGSDEELGNIARPPFPSPLATNGREIDGEALRQLDASLVDLSTFNNAFHLPGRMAFTYPITFGSEGGLIVGTGNNRHSPLVCFSSTPMRERERELIDAFGDPAETAMDDVREMGAGDASATVVALFNAVDPSELVDQALEGREKEHRDLKDVACTVFVSLLSRIAGNFLVRTKRCNWSNIRQDAFPQLFKSVAEEAVAVARATVKHLDHPTIVETPRYGMQVVSWKLGSTVYSPVNDA